jgi:aspartate carbamoyltransferase catalytic subunit
MPNEYKLFLDENNIEYHEREDMKEVLHSSDIVYVTRVQKERFSDPIEYEKVKNAYVLRKSMLENCKSNMRILHPLPRVNEIDVDVDDSKQAYYFRQALNGVYTRMAIITSILGLK